MASSISTVVTEGERTRLGESDGDAVGDRIMRGRRRW